MNKTTSNTIRIAKASTISILLILSIAIFMVSYAHASGDKVEEILRHLDQLYRSKTSQTDMEMQITTPNWERTLAMSVWTKGTDKTFIRITAPKKEKDVTTLRIGKEMWNYLPKVNKTFKISPSMMMGSWMGSDFTNDDLVRESSLIDDYTYKVITPDNASPDLIYIELIPKEDSPIVWGKVISAVRSSDYLPVWQHYYDEKEKLMRVLNYKEIKSFGSKTIPSVMEMIPQNKEGNKTVVRFLNAKYDTKVDDNIFTRRNLQRRN